jgi:hypothetical protein
MFVSISKNLLDVDRAPSWNRRQMNFEIQALVQRQETPLIESQETRVTSSCTSPSPICTLVAGLYFRRTAGEPSQHLQRQRLCRDYFLASEAYTVAGALEGTRVLVEDTPQSGRHTHTAS